MCWKDGISNKTYWITVNGLNFELRAKRIDANVSNSCRLGWYTIQCQVCLSSVSKCKTIKTIDSDIATLFLFNMDNFSLLDSLFYVFISICSSWIFSYILTADLIVYEPNMHTVWTNYSKCFSITKNIYNKS